MWLKHFILFATLTVLCNGKKDTSCNFGSWSAMCGWYVNDNYYATCHWSLKSLNSNSGYIYLKGAPRCSSSIEWQFGRFDGSADNYLTIEYYVKGPGPFTLKVLYGYSSANTIAWSCTIQPGDMKRKAYVYVPNSAYHISINGEVGRGSYLTIDRIWNNLQGHTSSQRQCPRLPTTLRPTTITTTLGLTTTMHRPTTTTPRPTTTTLRPTRTPRPTTTTPRPTTTTPRPTTPRVTTTTPRLTTTTPRLTTTMPRLSTTTPRLTTTEPRLTTTTPRVKTTTPRPITTTPIPTATITPRPTTSTPKPTVTIPSLTMTTARPTIITRLTTSTPRSTATTLRPTATTTSRLSRTSPRPATTTPRYTTITTPKIGNTNAVMEKEQMKNMIIWSIFGVVVVLIFTMLISIVIIVQKRRKPSTPTSIIIIR